MTFWNKVQQGVGRAAAEAEKQARIARINMQIGDAESTIRQKKNELGDVAFGLIRDGKLAEPSFETIVAAIDEQEAKITELRGVLAEVQAAPGATSSPGQTS